jgi:hypothetical protein
MSSKFTDFNLDVNSYAAFDATSLRDLITDRLNDQNIFTDQVFEGSNLSSMIDIVAYSYHVLMFYLNKTSSESMFTDSVVYENMNRIVKLLNYKPIGYRTAITSFQATAISPSENGNDGLLPGSYTIPRYSFVDVNGIPYSTREDIPFNKFGTDSTDVTIDTSKYLLYQGKYNEYPSYSPSGSGFETITIALTNNVLIDHHSIDVYVYRRATGRYTQWKEIESLFTASTDDEVYELRLNESYKYEVKFGNNINGLKLNAGDRVDMYYLKSDGGEGIIGKGALKDKTLVPYTTNRFVGIKNDIKDEKTNYLVPNNISHILLDNDTTSTDPQAYESVDDIKQNAPAYFTHQNRLITTSDFETYINTNYGNIVNDAKVVNNKSYIDDHMKYLSEELNLREPLLESRLLSNQVQFASSTTFNNVYIYVVPRLEARTSVTKQSNFLGLSQKTLIRDGLEKHKGLGLEPVFVDPVYVAVDICTSDPSTPITTDLTGKSTLNIVKSRGTPRSSEQLKAEVLSKLTTYFKHTNMNLGQTIDLMQVYSNIVSINGIESMHTVNGDIQSTGLSLLIWNPVYKHDVSLYNQNTTLPYYKFPYLYDITSLSSRITIID